MMVRDAVAGRRWNDAMDPSAQERATRVLRELNAGESSAVQRLLPLVYDELRAIAAGYLRHDRPDHTLQPTGLVHEAYLRLIKSSVQIDWQSRAHFRAVAARAMRQLLVDHARRKLADKRGGGRQRIELDEGLATPEGPRDFDLAAFDEVLERLAALDEEACRIVEMRYFADMNNEEVAHVIGVTSRTVRNKLAFVRAWFSREFATPEAP